MTLTSEITTHEHSAAITSMASGKALRHDKLPMDFFLGALTNLGYHYHILILKKKGCGVIRVKPWNLALNHACTPISF